MAVTKGEPSDAAALPGVIEVAFHIHPSRLGRVRKKLKRVFEAESGKDNPLRGWWEGPEVWKERRPDNREELLGFHEKKQMQADALASCVASMGARLYALGHLPFHVLLVRYELNLSLEKGAENAAYKMNWLLEVVRDVTGDMLGQAVNCRGEVVGSTAQPRTDEALQELRQDLLRLRQWRHRDKSEKSKKPHFTSPDLETPPLGRDGGYEFSHYLTARNIHSTARPTMESETPGSSWLVGIYEETSINPLGSSLGHIGTLDPLTWFRPTEGFKGRATGLIMVLVLRDWLRHRVPEIQAIQQSFRGRRLRNLLLSMRQSTARDLWLRLRYRWRWRGTRSTRSRRLVYDLRAVDEEYRFSIEEFLRIQKSDTPREVSIPSGGLDRVVETDDPPGGVVTRLVQGYQRDLDHAKNLAEEAWSAAKARSQAWATGTQVGTAIAVLVLTAFLAWPKVKQLGWFPW